MKELFKMSNRIDKKIHDIKQSEDYFNKIEGIKKDNKRMNPYDQFIMK